MARRDNLTNYLSDIATAIKNKKGDTTPILASNFDIEINNLHTGSDVVAQPLVWNCAINHISSGATVLYEDFIFNEAQKEKVIFLIIAMVRSDYTLSDNLTLIAESDWFVDDVGTTQKLIIANAEVNGTQRFTVTQANQGRMILGYIALYHAGTPEIILNETGIATETTVTTDDYLNLYVFSGIYGNTNGNDNEEFEFFGIKERLNYCISASAGEKVIPLIKGTTATPYGIIGLRIPRKKGE